MKKKILALFLAVIYVISCPACAGKGESQPGDGTQKETDAAGKETASDTKTEKTGTAETEKTGQADTAETEKTGQADTAETEQIEQTGADGGNYEYPSEDAGMAVQESPLGYSMPYDPTVFTLDDTTGTDVFTYNTAEQLDAPVYVSIQPYPDMDAQTLADGLALQSGMDGVEVSDVYFGAHGIETKSVYIERDAGGITQIQTFYAIPTGGGSLLIEIGGYAGMSQNIDGKIEEMLGNFVLTA